jgi:hypothetical protein
MSSELTTRLVNALEPLFDEDLKHKTIKKLQKSLKPLMSIAIHIRCLSLVGNEYYESIWPSTGSEFDREEMGDLYAGPDMGKSVRLPVCPGLRAYSKAGTVVSYKGFGKDPALLEPTKFVIRAMVLR